MLAARHRLRRRVDFADTVRRGRRAARSTLVVHLLAPAATPDDRPAGPARAGFVVSRAVGDSVTRHRVTRRLRHLVAARLDRLEPGSTLVVRALPAAAGSPSEALAADLDSALDRALAPRTAART